MDNRIHELSKDDVAEADLRKVLPKLLEEHAPVLLRRWMTPEEKARCLWNQGFRFIRKVRKGRWQTVKRSRDGSTLEIRGPLLEEFLKVNGPRNQ